MHTSTEDVKDDKGGCYHLVYNTETKKVVLNVWESPAGTLVALEENWVGPLFKSGTNVADILHQFYD